MIRWAKQKIVLESLILASFLEVYEKEYFSSIAKRNTSWKLQFAALKQLKN